MKRTYEKFAKRTLLSVIIMLFSLIGFAATYYVSNAGNDSNTGLLATNPWKTLTKINSATLAAGDVVLFRRGDTFFGSLISPRSYLTFSAYGTGAKPIISGFETITGWISQGNGIYAAPALATTNCNMVTVNGINTPMGRYPKTGWLTYESFVGRTSITDTQLTNTPNWTGAEVVIKKNNWTIDRSVITNHTNSTFTYTSGSTNNPVSVYGSYSYFLQKSIYALSKLGDWYSDDTNLYMYFGTNNPSDYIVKASVVDKTIVASSRNTNIFRDIAIEGSNVFGAYAYLSVNIQFINCDFSNNGDVGITIEGSTTVVIDSCTIDNTNGIAIDLTAAGSIVKNCNITNTAMVAGMGNADGASYYGMSVRSTGGIIENNTVTNTGYIPILFYNDNFKVRYNVVNGFCSLITDGAGIYTFNGTTPYTLSTGMEVYNNIVMNGGANGYYADGYTNNTKWYNNLALNCVKYGIRLNNILANNVYDNTFYSCGWGGISIGKLWHFEGYDLGNTLTNNITAQGINTSLIYEYEGPTSTGMGSYAKSDNNIFLVESASLKLGRTVTITPYTNTYYTNNQFKAFTEQDANSTLTEINLSDIQVEYNATKTPKTLSLATPMIDAKGIKYSRSITLQPFTSSVLMKDNNVASVTFTEYKSICEGSSYMDWVISGKYERTLTAASGGDSIVTTFLTVNPKYAINEDITINDGETYQGWTTSGQYSRTLTSVSGCDSIVTTNLTVENLVIKEGEIVPSHYTTVWQGENGQNHMNFIVVSAVLEDLPLSVDDEIAVFSGSFCVGTGKLTQSINAADNSTFLSIPASQNDGSNNGFVNNDTIIFKIWDNKNQIERIAKAVKYRNDISTWLINGKYSSGATAVVEIVSYAAYTQSIELIKGYNMISTYVTAENPSASAVTQSLLDQGNLIKMQDEAGNSYENWGSFGGWINKLGSIEKTEGYKIKVTNNCTLQVTGRYISLPLDIPLKTGWNIISSPRTDMVDAMSVVQTLIDQNKLVKVQDESGNSIENWGIFGGWKNGVGSFVPGKAYKVKLNADAILTLQQNYLKSAVILAKTENTEYFSTKIEGNGSDHMNINIVGLLESGLSVGDELAAFDGEICVGTLKINENHMANGTASLIVSLASDDQNPDGFQEGHSIQIQSWNQLTGDESKVQVETVIGQMIYEKNASVLVKVISLSTGMKSFEELLKIDVFPNPTQGRVTVRFSKLPVSGSRIDILDISGRKVTSRLITLMSEEFNLDQQPAGLYLVKSILGSNEIINKLIINK